MENKEVVTIEQTLAQLRSLKPDPYWQDSLRTLIVKEAVPKRAGGVLTFRWQPALIVALLLVLLASETAVLAQESFPGDLLYPVKRNLEEFRLVFAGQDDKLLLQQNLTERRVAELKQIVQTRRYKSAQPAIAEVEASVARVSEQVSTMSTRYLTLQQEGKDTTALRQNLEQLVPVIEQKQAQLAEIEGSLPEPTRAKVVEIKDSLETLETQVRNTLEKSGPLKPSVQVEPAPNQIPESPSTNEGPQNTP